MSRCRHCACEFEAKSWQIAKNDYECDPCRKARQANWRLRRKLAGKPVVSSRMPREYHRAYEAEYAKDPANRERRNAQMRGYAQQHKDRHTARRRLRSAIESGQVNRLPCEVCGTLETHGHHVAYDLPLAVTWLCQKHHQQLHAEAKATGAARATEGSV